MLTQEDFVGPWAGLPVAWDKSSQLDEAAYRAAVAKCCEAGVPGVYSGGTTGEFYAMEFDEFQCVARATVEECHRHGRPAMVGCTATSTRGAARRAAYAAAIGADAIQVALPFWLEVADDQIVPFLQAVSAAAGDRPLSIYETRRAKKALSLDQHRAVKDALPNYLMAKCNAGTVGCTPDGCAALSAFVNVFVSETKWGLLGPRGAKGACSAFIYWNPRIGLALWERLRAGRWDALDEALAPVIELHRFLGARFAPKGFTDSAYDHLCGVATGFLPIPLRSQAPYRSATPEDVEELRAWCREHYPDLLAP
ncbi:MAG: dihydrodipicolinate synthase family protein [Candidatus Hydrogenedentes bacterium]|nr:dihydrodipicolinate synthase family protein [Candidatus Hydrogenedentota bacterium]